MVPYLQTEFLNVGGTDPALIESGGSIVFDHPLNPTPPTAIIEDPATGIFTITSSGGWLVNWFVAQQTGLCPQGSNFAIVINRPLTDEEDPEYDPEVVTYLPEEVIVGSGHVKVSPTSGFAIINVSDEEYHRGGVRFTLRNESAHPAALSQRTKVKAGLAVFGVSGDMFKMGYGQWQAKGWDKYSDPYNLAFDEAIKFNDQIIPPLGIIATDSEEGVVGARIGFDVFTIVKPGVYQISWEIPIEATYSTEDVEIALVLDGSTVYSRSYAPIPLGVITGTAIVATTDWNKSISLVNKSLSQLEPDLQDLERLQIGNYTNLAIHQIS